MAESFEDAKEKVRWDKSEVLTGVFTQPAHIFAFGIDNFVYAAGNLQPPSLDPSQCATTPTPRASRCWTTPSSCATWLTALTVRCIYTPHPFTTHSNSCKSELTRDAYQHIKIIHNKSTKCLLIDRKKIKMADAKNTSARIHIHKQIWKHHPSHSRIILVSHKKQTK